MRKLILFLFSILAIFSCSDKKHGKLKGESRNYYLKALSFYNLGMYDSSFVYLELAKEQAFKEGDNLTVVRSLILIGINEYDQGDFFGAQETSLKSIEFLEKSNLKQDTLLSFAYNTIANSTDEMKQYNKAIPYYHQAIKYSTNPENTLMYKNNLAVCLRNAKRYAESIKLSEEILSKVPSGTTDYAKFLNNLAKTKWMADNSYNPVPDYHKALTIRTSQKDRWGQNSSYASLAKYYDHRKPDSSIYYLHKQYEIATEINSADDQLNALRGLIQSNSSNSQRYLSTYLALNDSIQQARSAAKNQFALIRYEVEKNKADNLRLEKENAEKQNRLIRQRAITGASIFLLVLVAGGGTLWYKRRKQRLELEAQNRVKETQLHLSKKIHDVVANGIYRVMSEIEHGDEVDRDGVLDKLENMYHQSRDISHDVEQETITEIPYNEQLASLLKSFAADHRKILIAGNNAEQWDDISKRIKDEVKHVLQELMVNMKKHSQAEQVVIRFDISDQQLNIFYKDNGVGIPEEKSKGKGITNTVSRIESLGGKITFVNEPGKGLNITTVIPL
ncbi:MULTISPECIES: tetratricopeptide repeat-containing sensor histidine kinase [unclassified Sphingobacterium]|uniref:tetratricopeptide repeat-containing sensor histidine kinase n=1 Tax=unclassified Sphingobacterium TaxID=2609468 RepID=UPI0025F835E0|nr:MULTISPECIES: ATP-binding protein [unclassified Sphingobacterium]